jgi:hypothetical protein
VDHEQGICQGLEIRERVAAHDEDIRLCYQTDAI